jgi:hypothetical protein
MQIGVGVCEICCTSWQRPLSYPEGMPITFSLKNFFFIDFYCLKIAVVSRQASFEKLYRSALPKSASVFRRKSHVK